MTKNEILVLIYQKSLYEDQELLDRLVVWILFVLGFDCAETSDLTRRAI